MKKKKMMILNMIKKLKKNKIKVKQKRIKNIKATVDKLQNNNNHCLLFYKIELYSKLIFIYNLKKRAKAIEFLLFNSLLIVFKNVK